MATMKWELDSCVSFAVLLSCTEAHKNPGSLLGGTHEGIQDLSPHIQCMQKILSKAGSDNMDLRKET